MAFRLRHPVLSIGGRAVCCAFQNVSIEVHREPVMPVLGGRPWVGAPLAFKVVTTDDVLIGRMYDAYSDIPVPPKRTLSQRIAGINASVAAKLERRRELGW